MHGRINILRPTWRKLWHCYGRAWEMPRRAGLIWPGNTDKRRWRDKTQKSRSRDRRLTTVNTCLREVKRRVRLREALSNQSFCLKEYWWTVISSSNVKQALGDYRHQEVKNSVVKFERHFCSISTSRQTVETLSLSRLSDVKKTVKTNKVWKEWKIHLILNRYWWLTKWKQSYGRSYKAAK